MKTPHQHTLTVDIQQSLQDAFRDPSSPFHIPPGSTGPASPDELPPELRATEQSPPVLTARVSGGVSATQNDQPDPAARARAKLISLGYSAGSLWEQSIVWGHHDAFRYDLPHSPLHTLNV